MVVNSDLVFPVIVLPIIIFTVILVGCGFLCTYMKKCQKNKSRVDYSDSFRCRRSNRRFSMDAGEVSVPDSSCHHCVRRRLSDQACSSDGYMLDPAMRLGLRSTIGLPISPHHVLPPHTGLSFYTIPMPDYDQPPPYHEIFGDSIAAELPQYEDLTSDDDRITRL